jgi:hypothetical protein
MMVVHTLLPAEVVGAAGRCPVMVEETESQDGDGGNNPMG